MFGKTSPWIERQDIVRIGATGRAVGRLGRKRNSCQGLLWRNAFGPINRSIFDRGKFRVCTELRTKLVFRRILTEIRDDRFKYGTIVVMARLASESGKRFRDRGRREPRNIIAKAYRAFGIKTLSQNVVTRVAECVQHRWNTDASTAGEVDETSCHESQESQSKIRRPRL